MCEPLTVRRRGAGIKDRLEDYLYNAGVPPWSVAALAQAALAGDWYAAYLATGRPIGSQLNPD